ncbi:MAG TPA: peptidoglycan-binding LysM [Lachnoclostridium phytofermentans]|uniref:Peptidoglycan-binding LysM n=1 Tax=Lachnoclostridium phytofermentans TaxID=66219 RepID=A0A3D2X8Q8_9FIRM|nr:LysM peptidoglycan-binding domain-containing protein [Lachnoclostridium sp.]HCL03501.1 peptidoglycan-binding LysM [Lachnoclostridium phytofermentans]
MYKVFLSDMLLPVTPSKIVTKIKNQNKSIQLLNEEEINLIKPAGLSEFSFTCLLPNVRYPFAMYDSEFRMAEWYTEKLKTLKNGKYAFPFIVARMSNKGEMMFHNDTIVTLEDYSITEDCDNGVDLVVDVTLKNYQPYGVVIVPFKNKGEAVKKSVRMKSKTTPKTYTVKPGDTLWKIAKELLGDGSKCYNLAKLNNISNPNLIRVGQVLRIEDVKPSTPSGSSNVSLANKKLNANSSKDVTLLTSLPSSNKALVPGTKEYAMAKSLSNNIPSITGSKICVR